MIADLYLDVFNLSGAITPLTFALLNWAIVGVVLISIILLLLKKMKLSNFVFVSTPKNPTGN